MALKIYRMHFQKAHFGDGYLNTSVGHFEASRLFSALCLEALKNDCLDEFINEAEKESFVLSDAFPYVGEPYLPKPVSYPKAKKFDFEHFQHDANSQKIADSLYAVPLSEFQSFVNGQADVEELAAKQAAFAVTTEVTKKGEDPYEVAVTSFSGALYVIAEQSQLLDQLMMSLQFSGLGGKRSAGYGSFDLEIMDLPDEMSSRMQADQGDWQLLLATSLPRNAELEEAMNNAAYEIKKDSGFAYSESEQELLRKQDLYKFKAGSIFKSKYKGAIVDVRPTNFAHPVYNFAKGLFYSFEV